MWQTWNPLPANSLGFGMYHPAPDGAFEVWSSKGHCYVARKVVSLEPLEMIASRICCNEVLRLPLYILNIADVSSPDRFLQGRCFIGRTARCENCNRMNQKIKVFPCKTSFPHFHENTFWKVFTHPCAPLLKGKLKGVINNPFYPLRRGKERGLFIAAMQYYAYFQSVHLNFAFYFRIISITDSITTSSFPILRLPTRYNTI